MKAFNDLIYNFLNNHENKSIYLKIVLSWDNLMGIFSKNTKFNSIKDEILYIEVYDPHLLCELKALSNTIKKIFINEFKDSIKINDVFCFLKKNKFPRKENNKIFVDQNFNLQKTKNIPENMQRALSKNNECIKSLIIQIYEKYNK
jgi:hypothetical protein